MSFLDLDGLARFKGKLDTLFAGKLNSSLKGAANGLAELDSNGKVPSSQLPSYVDDVLEYADRASFPVTGESGKIYIAQDTNVTYRWSGSAYVEISSSLALGETSSTAYRGDRGKTAYDHAAAKGSAFSSGMYKITTNAEGHVTAADLVTKQDIVDLGIPSTNTNTTYSLTQDATDGHKITLTPSSGNPTTITIPDNNTDVRNTAGATDTSSKIYLIGATSQAANPQTYSHDTAYVGTDGCLYSGGAKVLTAHQDISGKKNTQTAVSDPTAAGTATSFIKTISQNAQGVITPTKASLPTASTTVTGIVQLNNTLTSTSITQALTAAQGKVLNDAISNTQDGLAIIADGNTHSAIASGQFVYVKNHSSLADGLYKAAAAIATNGTLSTSNLTADASGGLNAIKADLDTLNSNFSNANDSIGIKSPNNKILVVGNDSAVTLWNSNTIQSYISNVVQNAWGSSLTFTYHNSTGHGLLLISGYLYLLWLSSTSNISVLGITDTKVFKKSGSGSITFGYSDESGSDVTITRNEKSITVTVQGTDTITWLGST